MKYRPEIDGLRAISVLSVLLFHLGNKPASGGFVGVDVFFVISGYLITTLVYTEHHEGRFSLASFYARRVKRIAPALLTTIFLTIAAGYLILTPGDYKSLARSGVFALGGASNFYFLEHTGYFDPKAATMPLLHTWSLGVEEQFYLLWPSLLLVLCRITAQRKPLITALLFALMVVSLGAYFLAYRAAPETAFYMPYTRAWEFSLGGIVALLPPIARVRHNGIYKCLPWIGVILIDAAVFRFRAPVDFTGNKVAAAAVGAFLIIYATEPGSRLHRILSWTPLVFVGKISYSLYLIHFPMIVLWKDYAEGIPDAYDLPLIAIAIGLSWLSWQYIEQPLRRVTWGWRPVFAALLAGELAIGSLCVAIIVSQGANARTPELANGLSSLEAMWDWPCPAHHTIGASSMCTGGIAWERAKAHAVIWGDSNAMHFMPMLDVAARREAVSISLLFGCAPILETGYAILDRPGFMRECDIQHREAVNVLKSKEISLVILSAAWDYLTPVLNKTAGDPQGETAGLAVMTAAFDRLLLEISLPGRTLAVITQLPNWDYDPMPCVIAAQTSLLRSASYQRTCRSAVGRLDIAHFLRWQQRTDELLQSFNGKYGTIILASARGLCSDRSCTTSVDGEFIYMDGGHLRRNLKQQTNADLAERFQFTDLMALAARGGIHH